MHLQPVILCGGHGSRLWPASSPSRPKQFLRLLGPRSLFQDTVLRAAALPGAAEPIIVAGEGHLRDIRAQLAEIGVAATVLVEPAARDSGPAIASASAWAATHRPGHVVAALACDHYIEDDAAFADAVAVAADTAEQGWIVTLGVRPSAPATAYGYIETGEPLGPGCLCRGAFL